jgi:predicted alpha/beta superfamily hydrolase
MLPQEFVMQERNRTASKNVHIINTDFPVLTLDRTRRIWLYLPENYPRSKRKYPVLYMHDGQNLFDDSTSFCGEWEVDETLDSIKGNCIVVGIDNGGSKRMNEYNPHPLEEFGRGEGKQYLEFIVKELKPYIDQNYRTLRSKKNTWMAGSSMGGLITFYAGRYYPKVFGTLGIFSPSFWASNHLRGEIRKFFKGSSHSGQKYYFYAGALENEIMVNEMLHISGMVQKHNTVKTSVIVRPGGHHNEESWRLEFPLFYHWINQQYDAV